VLIAVGCYLPGYKAGGPIRTIANLIDWLGDEFEFYVLTADRDLHDRQPYSSVLPGQWQTVGKAQVRYLAPHEQHWWRWREWLHSVDYDVLYLNSFFSSFTRSILALRRLGLTPARPIILAPRGEFSPGALGLKQRKKRFFLRWVRQIGLYDRLIWQATNPAEADYIRATLANTAQQIALASNLPARSVFTPVNPSLRLKQPSAARVVFLSRISRMKNLDFALRVLQGVTGALEFNVYGPIEDRAYWEECQSLIQQLPANVHVSYCGEAHPEQVHDIFSRHHLFLFPTRGENFGHVIFEALQAGCPVLASDRTPWRNLSAKTAGWDLPLTEPAEFARVLNAVVDMNAAEYQVWTQGAVTFAQDFFSDSALLEANRRLFEQSLMLTWA
jgi:glycosyltransferase involved in cell wall biosynthesis